MKEQWKDVVGFEEFYKVSNTGKILGKPRIANTRNNYNGGGGDQFHEGGIIAQRISSSGYSMVSLRKNGKQSTKTVHRVVFCAFNCYSPEYIDHIDRDKLNNRLDNLRAVTATQNNFNIGIRKDNKSGHKGVTIINNKNSTRYRARITMQGVITDSHHDTIEGAIAARKQMEEGVIGS